MSPFSNGSIQKAVAAHPTSVEYDPAVGNEKLAIIRGGEERIVAVSALLPSPVLRYNVPGRLGEY
jgi:hypothetical protein